MFKKTLDTAPKPRVFVLTSRVYETAGGRTKATIERMALLQKHFETTLIEMSSTKYPGQELPAVFAKYKIKFATINPWTGDKGSARIKQNYLNHLKLRTGRLSNPEVFSGSQESVTLPTLAGGKIKTYIENGMIARIREYHSDGNVEFFALDERQNIFLHELYQQGVLLSRHYLDCAGNVTAGFSIDRDGNKTFIYRQKDGQVAHSKTIEDHHLTFLKDTLRDGDILIADVRYYDAVLAQLPSKIRKVHVWHEIAIDASGQKVNPAYQTSASTQFPIGDRDKIIVFTDDTNHEYQKAFPHLKKHISVIPYGADIKKPIANLARQENLIISIGRLAPDKDIEAQIQAFSIFHKTYPQTYLKIYGEGSNQEDLQELIDRLNLQQAVELCGFSKDVNRALQSAAMMIFSSRHETFGLVVLESLSNGTPVASYDVRFGPRTMIKKRKNGIITQENTPESLAEAMCRLYELKLSPQKVQKSIKGFSSENFEKTWVNLISSMGKK